MNTALKRLKAAGNTLSKIMTVLPVVYNALFILNSIKCQICKTSATEAIHRALNLKSALIVAV